MAADGIPPDSEQKLQRAFERLSLEAYPNPQRVGCPEDRSVLKTLAQRKLRPSDPVVQHVAKCSPCMEEVQALRRQERRTSWLWAAAAAAVLLLAASLFLFEKRVPPPVPRTELSAVLDLRAPRLTQRGGTDPATEIHAPLRLGRGNLSLSILPPDNILAGHYEFQLLDHSNQPVRQGASPVTMQNKVPTVLVHLDMTPFPPGHYSLRLRWDNSVWQSYPVVLH